ncbi:MAG TPA: hypothetical protein VMB25_27125 [Bryobacteraceae bacterium]|nr:hypothetical protein [Bryobacteraceae bacterium]
MLSNVERGAPPFWLWPNLFSLDAPLVAVVWQGFIAYCYSVPLHPGGRAALGLTVWCIYLGDRLLDARQPPVPGEPARHRFYRHHRTLMLVVFGLALAADALAAALWLRPPLMREGILPLAGVLIYLAAWHTPGGRARVPKELAVAVLFTAGTFLISWTPGASSMLLWPALTFFLLCLANLVAIEAWEWRELPRPSKPHLWTRWLARTYLLWVPALGVLCLLGGRTAWYQSVALSAAASAVLFGTRGRLSLDLRRVLVDGVLLSPLLFLR